MARPPEMSAEFARVYAENFMDTGDTRELRWKGVVDVSSKANYTTVEVLVRLTFPSKVPAAGMKNENLTETYNSVVSTISGGDTTFNPTASGRELQILAASALVRLFATSSDAALAVVTASFGGVRSPELPMDLPGLAREALNRLAARQHLRADLKTLQVGAYKSDFAVSTEAMQTMDATHWSAELTRLRDTGNSALAAIAQEQNRVLGLLHRQITLDEEELQILWWLIGGFSRKLEKPFNDIDREERPLRIAEELAGLTKVLPGPASIKALLTRAGVGAEVCTIQEAVNAVEIDWAKQVTGGSRVSPVSTPLHFALEQKGELGSNDTWQPSWAGLTGIKPELSMPAISIAELFYREHLFLYVNA